MIFGIKEKKHHFDPYNVLLAIATYIPVLLMIGFVVQGYKCSHLQCTRLSQPPVGVPMYNHQRALFLTFVCFFWTSHQPFLYCLIKSLSNHKSFLIYLLAHPDIYHAHLVFGGWIIIFCCSVFAGSFLWNTLCLFFSAFCPEVDYCFWTLE